jgi:sulfur-oxidizing protein SoxX
MKKPVFLVALALSATSTLAQTSGHVDRSILERSVKDMFRSASPEWQTRTLQDETQRVCSETRNNPSPADFEKIRMHEAAKIEFPADGAVMGDWRKGATIAQNGRGGQFSDPPGTVVGGNCYACHQMDNAELSYGTLGPSLTAYGKIRKFDLGEARQTYAKIYDSHAAVPCSNMPRFEASKSLSMEQIKDVTAYLMSPESPVNK